MIKEKHTNEAAKEIDNTRKEERKKQRNERRRKYRLQQRQNEDRGRTFPQAARNKSSRRP